MATGLTPFTVALDSRKLGYNIVCTAKGYKNTVEPLSYNHSIVEVLMEAH